MIPEHSQREKQVYIVSSIKIRYAMFNVVLNHRLMCNINNQRNSVSTHALGNTIVAKTWQRG